MPREKVKSPGKQIFLENKIGALTKVLIIPKFWCRKNQELAAFFFFPTVMESAEVKVHPYCLQSLNR